MNLITINGTQISVSGRNVVMKNGRVTVDGVEVATGLHTGSATIKWEGDLASVQSDGSVECRDVQSYVSAGGSISCGAIGGNVDAGGSINCGDIGSNADAGGSINCRDVNGEVYAGGSVIVSGKVK